MDTMPNFSLDAGWLCLDFANTLGDRPRAVPQNDDLRTYADLVAFAVEADVLTPDAAARLRAVASARPDEAARVFTDAIALRETLYRVFSAVAAGETPEADDLTALNAAFAAAAARARVVPDGDHFHWEWPQETDALDAMLPPIAWSAADLLRAPEVRRVHECAGPDCGWLFIDRSKNGSRRWCDMKTCGNRAKARRHRTRQVIAAHGM